MAENLRAQLRLDTRNFTMALRSTRRGLRTFSRDMSAGLQNTTQLLTRMASAAAAVGAALGTLAIKEAFGEETTIVRLKTLLGGLKEARERFAQLKEFAATTPFQLDELVETNRLLQTFGGETLGSVDALRVIGDTAAGTGESMKNVGYWVGRFYAALKSGAPIIDTVNSLQRMGVLTPETVKQLRSMTDSTRDAKLALSLLNEDLGRFGGGMSDLSQTGAGLMSTALDNMKFALAEFGKGLMDVSKGGLHELIRTIQQLRDGGTFERWGMRVGEIVQAVKMSLKALAEAWRNLTVNQKSQIKTMLAVAAALVVGFKTGLVQPMIKMAVTVAAAMAKMAFSVIGVKGAIVGLTAALGFVAGYELGKTMEAKWNLSGILMKVVNFVKGVYDLWVGLFSNLGAAAILAGENIWKGLRGGQTSFIADMKAVFDQFNDEAESIAAGIKVSNKEMDSVADAPDHRAFGEILSENIAQDAMKVQKALQGAMSKGFDMAGGGSLQKLLDGIKTNLTTDMPDIPALTKGAETSGKIKGDFEAIANQFTGIFRGMTFTVPTVDERMQQQAGANRGGLVEDNTRQMVKEQQKTNTLMERAMEQPRGALIWAS